MAWIDVIEPDEAEPDSALEAFYERVDTERGNVANVHQIASLHPALGQAHLDLYMALMYDRDRARPSPPRDDRRGRQLAQRLRLLR